MTRKERIQFNQMRTALLKIWKDYQTPAQLRKSSEKAWGVTYEEAIEMAYENVKDEARLAVKGVRAVKVDD